MSIYQTLSLGSFIIAGAHYVRNGDDFWYVAWMAGAALMAIIHQFVAATIKPTEREGS